MQLFFEINFSEKGSDHVIVVSERLLFRKTFSKLLAVLPDKTDIVELAIPCASTEAIPLGDGQLVLLDCGMLSAVQISDILLAVLARDPESLLVVVIDEGDDERVAAAMNLGVMGVIVKASPPQHIVDTLVKIMAGERCRPAPGVTLAAEDLPDAIRQQLSAREQKMLRLMMGGQSISATARALDITPAKVVVQMRHIMSIIRVGPTPYTRRFR